MKNFVDDRTVLDLRKFMIMVRHWQDAMVRHGGLTPRYVKHGESQILSWLGREK